MSKTKSDATTSPSPVFSVYAQDMWAIGITMHTLLFNQLPFSMITPNSSHETGGALRDPMDLISDIHSCVPFPLAVLQRVNSEESGKDVDDRLKAHCVWGKKLLESLVSTIKH